MMAACLNSDLTGGYPHEQARLLCIQPLNLHLHLYARCLTVLQAAEGNCTTDNVQAINDLAAAVFAHSGHAEDET